MSGAAAAAAAAAEAQAGAMTDSRLSKLESSLERIEKLLEAALAQKAKALGAASVAL